MDTMLTEDAISLLLHGVVNIFPLVQISTLNRVNSLNLSTIRFQISISDDLHKHELLLPFIYSSLVENGQLKEGTIIKITQCTCSIVHNSKYVLFARHFFPLNQFHTVHASNVFLSHYSLTQFFSRDYHIACTRIVHSRCNNYWRACTLPLTCSFSLTEQFLYCSEP